MGNGQAKREAAEAEAKRDAERQRERQRLEREAEAKRQEAEAERQRLDADRQRFERERAKAAAEANARLQEARDREARLLAEENARRLAREKAEREAAEREKAEKNYPLQDYQVRSDWKGSVNVGLVGNSGVGKSSLSNNMRNVRRGQPGWANVGVNETTMAPTMYPFPNKPHCRLWDLPGAGTDKFPRDTYIRTVGLRHYDAVLVVTSGSFTETDTMLIQELREYNVPFFAVRTHIDVDIANNEADNGMTPKETKSEITDDLRRWGINDPYLVNSRKVDEHDFEKLRRDVNATMVTRRVGPDAPQGGEKKTGGRGMGRNVNSPCRSARPAF